MALVSRNGAGGSPTRYSYKALLLAVGAVVVVLLVSTRFAHEYTPVRRGRTGPPDRDIKTDIREPHKDMTDIKAEIPMLGQAEERRSQVCPEYTVPVMGSRAQIAGFLEQQHFQFGAEIGVQLGEFAYHMLSHWPSAKKYIMIDPWAPTVNYRKYMATQEQLNAVYNRARNTLRKWAEKTVFLRMLSSEGVKHIEDDSLDFIYIDARHDYCAVTEDLKAYWPKLRPGGLYAGHDYLYAADAAKRSSRKLSEHWDLCPNGTVHPGAVRGVVEDFARAKGLPISVTQSDGAFKSWMFRKPC